MVLSWFALSVSGSSFAAEMSLAFFSKTAFAMRSSSLPSLPRPVIAFLFSITLLAASPAWAQDAAKPADAAQAPAGAPADGGTATAAAASAGDSKDGIPQDEALIATGKNLFENNCTTCHAATDEVVVGPGLKNIHERRPLPWLINWIKNSSKVIQSGDPYAVELFNKYNKTQMPAYAFTDAEITGIVAYIKSESSKPAAASVAAGDASGGNVPGGAAADPKIAKYIDLILIVLIVVLIVMVITLLLIANIMTNYLKEKRELNPDEAELVNQKFELSKVFRSNWVRGLIVAIFVLTLLKLSLDKVMAVGVQQGYQPRQPIAFSHKIHAGEHQIDCNYCHTSVYKGKNANIPSANICMNCHNTIKKESPEIQKIYRSIEQNKPVEWVRIHNLPDLAYFNHAQHTNVGGIECQTCHGEIQTMDVVYQFAPLTMAWCINCHRETPLNTKDNKYYDNLVKIHNSGTKDAFTVASNGGLECSKCHY
jgi:mono/diheme cytochrome c family protein